MLLARFILHFVKYKKKRGHAVVYSWLGHYATRRKETGSTPDEVIEFFS
jgi:hypothetical protein